MSGRLRYRGLRVVATIAIILGVVAFWLLRPLKDTDFSTGEFTPVRDDALAVKFAPLIAPHGVYGAPTRLFYRMGKSRNGEIHIAYHPFYMHEENPHPGLGASLSRLIYTGGLGLKDIMFGPADIELIEVILDKSGKPAELAYEDAGDYNTKNFSVRHVPKLLRNPTPPFCFEVSSWNHMFRTAPAAACAKVQALKAEYFSESFWNEYRMLKKTEAFLRRNRMHRIYERVGVN